MERTYPKQFLRQLMLHRYKRLLQRTQRVYNLTEEQVAKLERAILNIEWLT